MKWEEYVKRIAVINKTLGEALKVLTNVMVDDKQKLILAETKLGHTMGTELLLSTPAFRIDEYFKDYDIMITFNPDIRNIDKKFYLAFACIELYCLFLRIKSKGGEIDGIDLNAFEAMGTELEKVGVSVEEVYQISGEICEYFEISFDKFADEARNNLENRGINIGGILRSIGLSIKNGGMKDGD